MKFIIFEQLSSLAHLKHNTQPSSFWILISILLTNLQYLALMLPFEGWNMWLYSDGHLKLIQVISQTSLIIPLWIEQNIDFSQLAFVITISLLFVMLFIIIILFLFGYLGNYNPAQYYTIRKFIFYFIVLQSTTFQLPILFLLFSQIITGSNTFNIQDSIFNAKSIINFITLLLFSIFTFLQQYFLRAYTFVPFNYFQSKFNIFQGIHFSINILITIIYFISNDTLGTYALISFLYLSIILKSIKYILAKPYIPWVNQFQFTLNGTLFVVLFIISINIFSENQYIPEIQLIYFIMVFGSCAFYFFQTIYERRLLLTFDAEINSFTCIPYTQEMHFKYLIASENQKQKEFFELYLYWKAHKIVCLRHWLKPNFKTDYNQIQKTHQTIFCILNTELDRARLESQQAYEELQMLYISYVAQFCNKPLLAYVELKRYQSQHQIQTYYFLCIRQQMSIYLQNLITQFQLENRINYFAKNIQNTDRQLSIQEIFQAFQFQDSFLPKVKEIINEKLNFWNRQIKGFNDIYEIQGLCLAQSRKIMRLAEEISDHCHFDIYNIDHISLSTNVQDLKLISIFCSSIMNDYHSTLICEQAISEVYNIEHTLSEDTITNLSFIQEKAIIIMLSMVKNRGRIINQDKKLVSQFFGYSEQEFSQFENIQDLMPSFFGSRHDKLLVSFLQTAKSQFLDDYFPVFGKSRNYMLTPYQLKIDNNFLFFDDYVIIGCLSQIKKSSDFIIFGEDGFLIGATDNFFKTIINNQEQIVDIGQINIFFLIPNISEIVNDLKNNFNKDIVFGYQDKYFRITRFNYKDLLEASQKIIFSRQFSMGNDSSMFKSRTSFGTQEQEKAEKQIYQQLGQASINKNKKGEQLLQQLAIFHSTYMNQISNAQHQLEGKSKINYLAKVNIQFKIIGKKENKKGYFILEINDLKKADELRANDSLINNPQTGSLSITQNINSVNDSQIGSFHIDKEEITPNISVQCQNQPKFARLLQKYESKPQQYMEEVGMESGRDSMSYGPLSQRINFISPSSKQQHVQELLDKDFTDLQNQLEFGENEINIEEKQESSRIKSNSNQANQKSNNLLEIFTKNKLDDKIENQNLNAKKSKSSVTSGTSGISAISTIKKFQQKKEMTASLKWLLAINSLIAVILLIYMIAHLLQVTTYDESILQTLANINGPMLFNRYFFKLFTYTWSLVFNSLGIIESSDYLITQTIVQMEDLSSKIFVSLNTMYDLFIGVEQQGLLSLITLDFLYQSSENVTYTYFIDLISNTAQTLFLALDYNVTNLIELIDKNYMDNLLTLRYNLKNVVNMNFQLIDSLNILFFQQQSDTIQQFQIQIIIEIIALFFIIVVQLMYWRQLEQYCQQIILLVGRLQFNQAQEMIIRFTAVLETLQQLSGKSCWKQSNYYKMLFLPLNQIGIETIQTQSRILKEYQLTQTGKKSLNFNPIVEQRQLRLMKNSNVVLNSRINNTSISILKAVIIITITYIILLVYILGGYLFYQQQQNELYPTQQLTMSFIRFTSQLDIVVSTALITKSQPLFYSKLVEIDVYSQEQINEFRDQRIIIKIFLSLFSTYYENITVIYENIIKSNKISSEDQGTLLDLYQNDFCLLLLNEIPFCHYGDKDFDLRFGIPDARDNNKDYLSKGVQGIVSQLDTIFKQNFQYEITNVDYTTEESQLLAFMSSQQFTNAIMEHFIDTTDGTNLFVDKLMSINQKLISQDLALLYTYYLVTGILLLGFYILFYGCWIYSSNNRLIQLRLVLTNLPIDILTEPQMLSQLKKLY